MCKSSEVITYIASDVEVYNTYYLSAETYRMGSALYYKTNKGDYVYYGYTSTTYESFDGTTYKRDESAKYTSAIWYVMYTTQCRYEYTYQSDGKHIQKCTICGQTKGSLQSCIYLNNTCRLCGHYDFTPILPKSRLLVQNIQEVKW